ncbi:ABC transporter ATP-binding protein [Leptolyngbya sp. FACHB-261]|uniref:ABC transporter ATP-binding protein n=1 Tax=Leptolyngbya sp. FACHB-261 TaxID=2692806 RepID=UPI00168A283B|nr:ABC transporter ATP-binding protein [Leptolyngbya sp. FACHB-261]MBD2099631.1 ATP-binding cassette domain-containing protein [Leptolyngbya sp. FACHB-261]
MSDTVIRVENLSKRYRIGAAQKIPKGKREALVSSLAAPFSYLKRAFSEPSPEEVYWALKDVSFEVKQGEIVGIIGRNGAGKSTLLKILSRITEPTSGFAEIRGRVGSLLEVGTGFHPDLTGRENIYLNGTILGMRKWEIDRKLDEIVAFAEVEKFLDTPVKYYSSGMYVRLAFGVAAHLEPEILIVDEVLAVGDSDFQKKCLGKMKEVRSGGRTVLFVSHNVSVIQTLCERCLVLQKGLLLSDQTSTSAIQNYLQNASANSFARQRQVDGNPTLVLGQLEFINQLLDSKVRIDVEVFTNEPKQVSLDLRLSDGMGSPVGYGSFGALDPTKLVELKSGLNRISFTLSTEQLAVGTYSISLDLTLPDVRYYDRVEDCLQFEVVRTPSRTAKRVLPQSWRYGSLELTLRSLKEPLTLNDTDSSEIEDNEFRRLAKS